MCAAGCQPNKPFSWLQHRVSWMSMGTCSSVRRRGAGSALVKSSVSSALPIRSSFADSSLIRSHSNLQVPRQRTRCPNDDCASSRAPTSVVGADPLVTTRRARARVCGCAGLSVDTYDEEKYPRSLGLGPIPASWWVGSIDEWTHSNTPPHNSHTPTRAVLGTQPIRQAGRQVSQDGRPAAMSSGAMGRGLERVCCKVYVSEVSWVLPWAGGSAKT